MIEQNPRVLLTGYGVMIALYSDIMTRDQANSLREQLAGIEPCVWIDNGAGCWDSGCGNAFEFTEDGPEENRAKFCPFCGRKIEVKKYEAKNQDGQSVGAGGQ